MLDNTTEKYLILLCITLVLSSSGRLQAASQDSRVLWCSVRQVTSCHLCPAAVDWTPSCRSASENRTQRWREAAACPFGTVTVCCYASHSPHAAAGQGMPEDVSASQHGVDDC